MPPADGDGDRSTVAASQERRIERLSERTRRLRRQVRRRRAALHAADLQSGREASSSQASGASGLGPKAADFSELEAKLGGGSGLAVSAIGRSVAVKTYGSLTTGSAWSTMKVPVAIAALKDAGGTPGGTTEALLRSTITASDNAAAEQLWSSLGPPSEAGRKTQEVLTEGGDGATRVQTTATRSGFSSFGQTQWALADQQRFVAALPCSSVAEPVLSLMGQTVTDQQWGLAATGLSADVKGGWGPGPDGRYLVRQMGLVQLSNGNMLAATMATVPRDGSFESGKANLTTIAQWLVDRVDVPDVPVSSC